MTLNIYQPTKFDDLSLDELELYHLLMSYRAQEGLPAIPLSSGLTATAGRHAADTYYNMMLAGMRYEANAEGVWGWPSGGNLHSWSDAPYFSDHRDPEVMWFASQRLGIDYPAHGFEISAAGYADAAQALLGWQGSPSHDQVIVNEGTWQSIQWGAIGVGMLTNPEERAGLTLQGNVFHVWFGREPDPSGAPLIRGTDGSDTIIGTKFSDIIHAGDGNDTIIVRSGNDLIDGGNGWNIAMFSGLAADYRVSTDTGTTTVIDLRLGAGNEGTNTLRNIQELHFADSEVKLHIDMQTLLPDVVDGAIYRFYNLKTAVHFLTTSSAERDMIINSMPTFRYEGIAFTSSAGQDDGLEIYRFYNTETGAHFYTASEDERKNVIAELPWFAYEGAAFYAFEEASPDREAVYRFYNTETGTHFYTANENERDDVMTSLPSFNFEGVAYYVDVA